MNELADKLSNLLRGDAIDAVVGIVLFLLLMGCGYFLFKAVTRRLLKRASTTKTRIDDYVIEKFRMPALWLMFWFLFVLFGDTFFSGSSYSHILSRINGLLTILTIGWILIKIVRVLFYYFEHKLDANDLGNYKARGSLTKMKIFEGIVIGLITFLIVAACLMSFEKVRTVGVSLLTSAGIAGIIVGLAAQKSLGAVLAGIQIAITQPIRLDDVVIVEGEWGTIEEITLTYVVVRIWDERRLVLPVTYFLEKPFQNWTRTTLTLLGTVFVYVDFEFPVDDLRSYLDGLLPELPKWDKRVANVQVTDMTFRYKELRILVSSINSSDNYDLRVDLREKIIDYINREHPDTYAKVRLGESYGRDTRKGNKEG